MWHPQRDRRTDWEGRGERRDRSCEETGSPAGGEDASGEESAWKQLAAYPGTRVLHNLQEPVGCHLPEASREGSWKEGGCTGSSGKCGSGFPGTVRLGLPC